jgi:hypothetical protein
MGGELRGGDVERSGQHRAAGARPVLRGANCTRSGAAKPCPVVRRPHARRALRMIKSVRFLDRLTHRPGLRSHRVDHAAERRRRLQHLWTARCTTGGKPGRRRGQPGRFRGQLRTSWGRRRFFGFPCRQGLSGGCRGSRNHPRRRTRRGAPGNSSGRRGDGKPEPGLTGRSPRSAARMKAGGTAREATPAQGSRLDAERRATRAVAVAGPSGNARSRGPFNSYLKGPHPCSAWHSA